MALPWSRNARHAHPDGPDTVPPPDALVAPARGAEPSAPGWFGKVAMLGDFASRRLASGVRTRFDDWLSAALSASRDELGDAWLDTYLSAPVWRFAIGPDVVDEAWWFGVLMPSCDSVGRYFPLLVAQPRARPPADRVALDHLELWWRHVADAALSTLTDGATLDAFEVDLDDAPRWPSALGAGWLQPAAPAADGSPGWSVAAGASVEAAASGLAAAGLVERLRGASLWWPAGPVDRPGRCTIAAGLPPAHAFAAMLEARW